jgi:hypothetical protein
MLAIAANRSYSTGRSADAECCGTDDGAARLKRIVTGPMATMSPAQNDRGYAVSRITSARTDMPI